MMPAQDLPRSQNPTQKVFWKEEREDGAIYAVSLKKVRYRSTDKLLPSPEEEVPAAVSHLQWETWRIRTIKAGTLAKLVEHLCPSKATSEEVEPGYLLAFLTTYRTFAAASEVVQLLLERYRAFHQNEAGEKEDIVDRVLRGVISVLSVWLEQFPFDFDEPPMYPTLSNMLRCVQTEMKESHRDELARKIQQRLDKFKITPFEDEADLVTFQLPMSSNWNPSKAESDMCSIPEDLDECKADLLTMKSTTCAEQLTLMDAKLFKKVVAWHCLGCMWSKNKKEGTAPTVKATVDQFNAVSLRVISSILMSSRSKSSGPNTRAKFISCWIAVAQECRDLKNFSSLKAILSGLQSAPIHRLKKTWSHISRDSLALFQELSNIFSEDSNQQISRELLMREGTAKWAEMDTSPTKKNTLQKKRKSRFMDLGIIQGTVPYLGTFLTDLMMLDTAYPNVTEDGLINFEKRKKEFEIIAQIKLLQEAAKNYILVPDEAFRKWFDCIKTHTEHDSYRLSCEVERVEQRYSKKKTTRLRRMVSEPDISKMTLSAQSLAPPPVDKECKSTETSPVTARHKRNNSGSSLSSSSSGVSSGSDTSSVPNSCSASLPRPFLGGSTRGRPSSPSRASKIGLLRLSLPLALPQRPSPESPSPRTAHAGCIIRVSLEGPEDTNSGVIYKGIWLSDDERTPAVIRSCLTKREMEGNASDYSLVQLLSNGTELLIPDNANVYYALNSNVESLLFKLKKKKKENGQTS